MKAVIYILCIITLPAFAQSDYYANRYSGRATEITPSNQAGFNTVNGYYYNSTTKTYYKGKNINRDAGAQPTPQGSLSFTYDRNQYAPMNLSINR
jgi:hypothetical protein